MNNRPLQSWQLPITLALLASTAIAVSYSQESKPGEATEPTNRRRAQQQSLEVFNDWVGSWRGVGQPRRGSNQGAWIEQAHWAWQIDKQSAELRLKVEKGKLLTGGVLAFDPEQKQFRFTAALPEEQTRVYSGQRPDKGKLLLESTDEQTGGQHRLSFHMLHADRLILLVEHKPAGRSVFSRVAEIGYTREGGKFAAAGDSYPKCVVTGGRGTMTVSYKGQTYYVCCTGCRQAFEDDPEGVLAEAQGRKQREAKAQKKEEDLCRYQWFLGRPGIGATLKNTNYIRNSLMWNNLWR